MEICKGNYFCNGKIDLQWCKNATSLNQIIPIDWKPIYEHFMCAMKPQQDVITSHGQWIKGGIISKGIFTLVIFKYLN